MQHTNNKKYLKMIFQNFKLKKRDKNIKNFMRKKLMKINQKMKKYNFKENLKF